MINYHVDHEDTQTFDIEIYKGQQYNADEKALTVAMVENSAMVYLVPLAKEDGRLKIEELHRYLMLAYGRWEKTHTIYKVQYCDFVRPC